MHLLLHSSAERVTNVLRTCYEYGIEDDQQGYEIVVNGCFHSKSLPALNHMRSARGDHHLAWMASSAYRSGVAGCPPPLSVTEVRHDVTTAVEA